MLSDGVKLLIRTIEQLETDFVLEKTQKFPHYQTP